MAIARFENVVVNNLTFAKDVYGEQATAIVPWFTTRAIVKDVRNSVRISDRYRVYSDLVDVTFQYTPNMKGIVDNQDKYSFTSRSWLGNTITVRNTDTISHI